jgi:hypothetical protein
MGCIDPDQGGELNSFLNEDRNDGKNTYVFVRYAANGVRAAASIL